MVKPDVIGDDQVILLARTIAHKIEESLDYPGQIKVNVIRESRAVNYAKNFPPTFQKQHRPLSEPKAGGGLFGTRMGRRARAFPFDRKRIFFPAL